MALIAQPAFVGQITITTGVNDTIHWREDNGTPYDLTTVISAGAYWPDNLAALIGVAMSNESTSNGYGATYTWSFSEATGQYSVSVDTGQFYLKDTIAETQNLLTGGDSDTRNGASLAIGQWGQNGIGWAKALLYGSLASSATAPLTTQHYWTPPYPPQKDDDGLEFDQTIPQSVSIAGKVKTYDWSGWDDDNTEFPTAGNDSRTRELSFEFVTTEEKERWISQFWGPYGKSGNTFRYHPDRNNALAYELYVLTGRNLRNHGFSERINGYKWWRGAIEMQRVSA